MIIRNNLTIITLLLNLFLTGCINIKNSSELGTATRAPNPTVNITTPSNNHNNNLGGQQQNKTNKRSICVSDNLVRYFNKLVINQDSETFLIKDHDFYQIQHIDNKANEEQDLDLSMTLYKLEQKIHSETSSNSNNILFSKIISAELKWHPLFDKSYPPPRHLENNTYFAIGNNSTILYSKDKINWKKINLDHVLTTHDVIFNDIAVYHNVTNNKSTVVAIGTQGTILYANLNDLNHWHKINSYRDIDYNDIDISNTDFISISSISNNITLGMVIYIIGNNGTVLRLDQDIMDIGNPDFKKWKKVITIKETAIANNVKLNSFYYSCDYSVAVGSNKTVIYTTTPSVSLDFDWKHATLPETIADNIEFNYVTKGHQSTSDRFIAVGNNRSIIYSTENDENGLLDWHSISLDKFNNIIPVDTNFTEIISIGKQDPSLLRYPELENFYDSFIVIDETKTHALLLKKHVLDDNNLGSEWSVSLIKLTEDVLANMHN